MFKNRSSLHTDEEQELKALRLRLHPDKNKFRFSHDAFVIVNHIFQKKRQRVSQSPLKTPKTHTPSQAHTPYSNSNFHTGNDSNFKENHSNTKSRHTQQSSYSDDRAFFNNRNETPKTNPFDSDARTPKKEFNTYKSYTDYTEFKQYTEDCDNDKFNSDTHESKFKSDKRGTSPLKTKKVNFQAK